MSPFFIFFLVVTALYLIYYGGMFSLDLTTKPKTNTSNVEVFEGEDTSEEEVSQQIVSSSENMLSEEEERPYVFSDEPLPEEEQPLNEEQSRAVGATPATASEAVTVPPTTTDTPDPKQTSNDYAMSEAEEAYNFADVKTEPSSQNSPSDPLTPSDIPSDSTEAEEASSQEEVSPSSDVPSDQPSDDSSEINSDLSLMDGEIPTVSQIVQELNSSFEEVPINYYGEMTLQELQSALADPDCEIESTITITRL